MLDFSSALYLGLRHPSAELAPWDALTEGRPAALGETAAAQEAAAVLARLQGCESGVLLPSSLHLFRDLFLMLATERVAILCDGAAYPIARWGAEAAAAARRVPVRHFPHHDAEALARLAGAAARTGRRPVVLTDGLCPSCGRIAPLARYAEIADRGGGWLVVDDTQALGVLGEAPSADRPYGRGGGGSLRWRALSGERIVTGSSLAKGFGAPLAVLAGSAGLVEHFRATSETRTHCSPPSMAAVRAAGVALARNVAEGETLRAQLMAAVRRLRTWVVAAGGMPRGGLPLPVLSCVFGDAPGPLALHRRLLQDGIRSLLMRACDGLTTCLGFVLTAGHRNAGVDQAGRALLRAVRGGYPRRSYPVEAT